MRIFTLQQKFGLGQSGFANLLAWFLPPTRRINAEIQNRHVGIVHGNVVPASREDLDVPLLALAVEEHARLDACNAGVNTRSPVIQHCEPVAPF